VVQHHCRRSSLFPRIRRHAGHRLIQRRLIQSRLLRPSLRKNRGDRGRIGAARRERRLHRVLWAANPRVALRGQRVGSRCVGHRRPRGICSVHARCHRRHVSGHAQPRCHRRHVSGHAKPRRHRRHVASRHRDKSGRARTSTYWCARRPHSGEAWRHRRNVAASHRHEAGCARAGAGRGRHCRKPGHARRLGCDVAAHERHITWRARDRSRCGWVEVAHTWSLWR